MNNMPFLKQVACHYAGLSLEDLSKFCFVFPTQRSGFFFNDYFRSCVEENGERYVVSPLITTFDRQVGDWSGMIKGSQAELQLILYKTYLEDIRGKRSRNALENGVSAALEPDRFLYWCELILGDFSDVDMALADPAHLFRNLKENKELQTLPLDEEQLELVRKFWNTTGVPWLNPEFEADRMWIYSTPDDKNVGVRNFLKLWEVLGPLYDAFNKRLRKAGLAYKGMIYREASEILEKARNNSMTLEKQTYVFVGMPFLSRAEKAILSTLKKWGKAEFFWDTVMPDIGLESRFPFRLVDGYASTFPMPEDFESMVAKGGPEINIYSVPSTIVQAKRAASIISNDKTLNTDNATEFAVVLPEARLCLPLLSSVTISDDIGCNISIGFPIKDTPMASLMNVVVQLKATANHSKKGWFVSRQRVEEIATQPILLASCPQECKAILSRLRKTRGTFVNADVIAVEAGRLGFLFSLAELESLGDVIANFLSIIDSLLELCEPYTKVIKKLGKTDGEDKEEKRNLPREFLVAYREVACELLSLIRKYDLEPALESTPEPIFATLDKMMRRMQLSFAGVPLQGVQIMGVMESYLLDFERVIITSMNENSFPKKLQKRTFIPQKLRVAYGLDNMEDEETLNAYYFYRLIGRTSVVDLLYNSNTDGLKAGEFSRYIYQLRYLATRARISEQTLDFVTWKPKESPVRVTKDDYAMQQLEAFLPDSECKKRYLSASSIKKYLSCPLEFYLNVVSGFADEDNDVNHINDSDYGTITHAIMEQLYESCPKVEWQGEKYYKVTVDELNVLLNDVKINEVADAVVRKYYYNDSVGKPVEIEGEAMIFRDMAVDSVVEMLKAEKLYMLDHDISHFLFVGAEIEGEIELQLPSGRKVNFRYIIDRVDRMFPRSEGADGKGYLRIVDYKTGGDKLNFSGIDALVDYEAKGSKDHPKAIMQLLLYSIAYAADKKNSMTRDERIQPLIYSFRNIMESNGHIKHLKDTQKGGGKSGVEMLDYNEWKQEFMQKIGKKIDELFDRNKDFIQTSNSENCQFCRFKSICAR